MRPTEPVTGLILSGGGARAAYQVGVLAAIAELLPPGAANPFPVIVGTSAGAINAVSLASGAMDFTAAIARLTAFWQGFRSHLVLRSDWPGVIHQASRFLSRSLLGLGSPVPVALLDSSPLRELLQDKLHFEGINEAIRHKHLHAVAVTAFGYESGQAVTFYQGGGTIDAWLRHRRIGLPTQLTVEHLLASSAIPLLFAPVKLDQEYFGDGAVRQSAPISPALHLGATRVLVVGVSGNPRSPEPSAPQERSYTGQQPTLAQIGGHMLNSTFIDSLESDIELLERLNQFSHLQPANSAARGAFTGRCVGDCAQPADRRNSGPPSPGTAGGIAVVLAWARGDQDQRGRGAQLSVVRGRVLQRVDRVGAPRCIGQARGVAAVPGPDPELNRGAGLCGSGQARSHRGGLRSGT